MWVIIHVIDIQVLQNNTITCSHTCTIFIFLIFWSCGVLLKCEFYTILFFSLMVCQSKFLTCYHFCAVLLTNGTEVPLLSDNQPFKVFIVLFPLVCVLHCWCLCTHCFLSFLIMIIFSLSFPSVYEWKDLWLQICHV